MEMVLYNTTSSNNTINKVLTNGKNINIKFKDIANVINPIVKLSTQEPFNFNYGYIPDFKRFYFIEDIEINPNNFYTIRLRCDVLESYKNDILSCNGYVTKQEKINRYYDDNYQAETRKEVDIYKSDFVLKDKNNIVLTTIGG